MGTGKPDRSIAAAGSAGMRNADENAHSLANPLSDESGTDEYGTNSGTVSETETTATWDITPFATPSPSRETFPHDTAIKGRPESPDRYSCPDQKRWVTYKMQIKDGIEWFVGDDGLEMPKLERGTSDFITPQIIDMNGTVLQPGDSVLLEDRLQLSYEDRNRLHVFKIVGWNRDKEKWQLIDRLFRNRSKQVGSRTIRWMTSNELGISVKR